MSTEEANKRSIVLDRLRARRHTAMPFSQEATELGARGDEVSFGQERLWFLERFNPVKGAYNEGFRVDFTKCPDILRLSSAFDAILARHEALRTRFVDEGSYVRQVVEPGVVQILEIDESISSGLRGESEEQLSRRITDFIRDGFDLEKAPLLRTKLFAKHDGGCSLAFANHHAICDARSRTIILHDLQRAYRGEAFENKAPSFRSFSRRQRIEALSPATVHRLERLKEALADAPPLSLPLGRSADLGQPMAGGRVESTIGPELLYAVETASRRLGVTPYILLVAAWGIVLAKTADISDLVVGVPSDARDASEASMVGFCVSVIPVRLSIDSSSTLSSYIHNIRDQVLGTLENREVSFEQIVKAINPPRILDRSPIFQTMVSLEGPAPSFDLGPCHGEATIVNTGIARLELTLEITPKATDWLCGLSYRKNFTDEQGARSLVSRLLLALEALTQKSAGTVAEVNLTSVEEKATVLHAWNHSPKILSRRDDVMVRLKARCTDDPSLPAVRAGGTRLCYGQLWEAIEAWVDTLTKAGSQPGDRIAVSLAHSVHLPAAIFAIWHYGGVYVPLDPAMGFERLATIVADASIKIAICDPANVEKLRRAGVTTCLTPGKTTKRSSEAPPLEPNDVPMVSAAYIFHTSGSTGRPKGVVVSRGSLCSFLKSMDGLLDRDEPQVWLASTSISFDVSILELVWTLSAGAEIVLAQQQPVLGPVPLDRNERRIRTEQDHLDLSLFFFAADSNRSGADRYSLLFESARFADAAGFKAIWTPERHFHQFGGLYPNPAILSAALARETKRIALRAGSVVAPLHHPVRLAEDWSLVDNLSDGRAGVALAAGWNAEDFIFAPSNYDRRYQALEESVATLRTLWSGETMQLPNGCGNETAVTLFPKPVQSQLPLWLTASGARETFSLAGRLNTGVLTHLIGQRMEQAASNISEYRSIRAKYSYPGRGNASLMLHTHISARSEEKEAETIAALQRYFSVSADLIRSLAKATGQKSDVESIGEDNLKAIVEQAVRRHVSTSSLIGNVDKGRKICQRALDAGFTEIACLVDFGLDDATVLEGLQDLAELREAVAQKDRYTSSTSEFVLVDPDVTHAQFTPTLLRAFLNTNGGASALSRLRGIVVGGEALTDNLAGQLRETGVSAFNVYGPTEATVWATAHAISEDESASTIGRPLENVRAYVLCENRKILGPGLVGDLWLSGPQIAEGYLGRVDETANAFVTDPYVMFPDVRMYRTGDRAVWTHDGKLVFLGRTDDQIKLRGIRIELGEVESIVRGTDGVSDCAATLVDTDGEERVLAVYVVMEKGSLFDGDIIRSRLYQYASSVHIPSLILPIQEIPRTLSGKADRRKLSSVSAGNATSERKTPKNLNYSNLSAKLLETIVELWQDELKLDDVDIDENFFEAGGHSLAAARLVAKLHSKLGVEVPLVKFFQNPTARHLVEIVASELDQASQLRR